MDVAAAGSRENPVVLSSLPGGRVVIVSSAWVVDLCEDPDASASVFVSYPAVRACVPVIVWAWRARVATTQVTFLQRLVDLSSDKDKDGAASVTFSLPLIQVSYPMYTT